MSLSGRVAAITGASSGIGLACARHLAREGVAVVLGARRISLLEATAAQIRAAGGSAAIAQIDVVRESDVHALAGMAVREFGRLDVMICNAGFGYYGAIDDTPADVMRRMMDVNFMGTFYGATAALPLFRRQNSGHLIFVSSIVGRRGVPQMGAYTATKAAQAGLAESLRAEFVGTPIHVELRLPGVDADRVHASDGPRLRPPHFRTRSEADGGRRGPRDCRLHPPSAPRGLSLPHLARPCHPERARARRSPIDSCAGTAAVAR